MYPHPFSQALNRNKARDSKPKPSSLGKNLPQDLDPEILTFYGLWALGLDKQASVQKDFICGLHFTEDKFRADGKLEYGAIPTFFPVQKAASHDHNYHQVKVDEETDYDGGIFKNKRWS